MTRFQRGETMEGWNDCPVPMAASKPGSSSKSRKRLSSLYTTGATAAPAPPKTPIRMPPMPPVARPPFAGGSSDTASRPVSCAGLDGKPGGGEAGGGEAGGGEAGGGEAGGGEAGGGEAGGGAGGDESSHATTESFPPASRGAHGQASAAQATEQSSQTREEKPFRVQTGQSPRESTESPGNAGAFKGNQDVTAKQDGSQTSHATRSQDLREACQSSAFTEADRAFFARRLVDPYDTLSGAHQDFIAAIISGLKAHETKASLKAQILNYMMVHTGVSTWCVPLKKLVELSA